MPELVMRPDKIAVIWASCSEVMFAGISLIQLWLPTDCSCTKPFPFSSTMIFRTRRSFGSAIRSTMSSFSSLSTIWFPAAGDTFMCLHNSEILMGPL